jgi:hypothetical protein
MALIFSKNSFSGGCPLPYRIREDGQRMLGYLVCHDSRKNTRPLSRLYLRSFPRAVVFEGDSGHKLEVEASSADQAVDCNSGAGLLDLRE